MLKQWKHQRQLNASALHATKGLQLHTSHTLAEQLLEVGSFFTTAGIVTAANTSQEKDVAFPTAFHLHIPDPSLRTLCPLNNITQYI
jgi:hypothetical protein